MARNPHAGFVNDLVVISRPNLALFPVFFPVIRKFEFGGWFESVSQAVRRSEKPFPKSPEKCLPMAGFHELASLRCAKPDFE